MAEVETAIMQLISKVEESQSLIDSLELKVQELKLQLEVQESENQRSSLQLLKMQEELEYYFLMSRKQSEIINAAEELQDRSNVLLARVVS